MPKRKEGGPSPLLVELLLTSPLLVSLLLTSPLLVSLLLTSPFGLALRSRGFPPLLLIIFKGRGSV